MTFLQHLIARGFVQKFYTPLVLPLPKQPSTWLLKPFLPPTETPFKAPRAGVFLFNGFSIWTVYTVETCKLSCQPPTQEVPMAPHCLLEWPPPYPGGHGRPFTSGSFCYSSLISVLFAPLLFLGFPFLPFAHSPSQ